VNEPHTAVAVTSRQQRILDSPIINPAETTEGLLSIQLAAIVFLVDFDLLWFLWHGRFRHFYILCLVVDVLLDRLDCLKVDSLCKLVYLSGCFLSFLLPFDAQLAPDLSANRPIFV
jgi:hypothetical protein